MMKQTDMKDRVAAEPTRRCNAGCVGTFSLRVAASALTLAVVSAAAGANEPRDEVDLGVFLEQQLMSGIGLFYPDTNRTATVRGGAVNLTAAATNGFSQMFLENLDPVGFAGMDVYPVTLRTRDADGVVEFRNAQSNVIHTLPPSAGNYTPSYIADLMGIPAVPTNGLSQETLDFTRRLLLPSHVEMEWYFVDEANLSSYIHAWQNMWGPPAGWGGGGSSPEDRLCFTSVSADAGAVHLALAWPDGFPLPGGMLDILHAPSLSPAAWQWVARLPVDPAAGAAVNAIPLCLLRPAPETAFEEGPTFTNTVASLYADGVAYTNIVAASPYAAPDAGFFLAASLVDSLGTGVSDAIRRYVYGDIPPVQGWQSVSLGEGGHGDDFNDPGGSGGPGGLNVPGPFPPPEDARELVFTVGGDYAAWEMKIQGLGPDDLRVITFGTGEPGQSRIVTNKLWKGNAYRVTMSWLGSGNHIDPYWYCWMAKIDGFPAENTYNNYDSARRPGVAELFGGEGWFAKNANGLLTSHVHMKDDGGGNVAEGLEATLYVLKDVVPDWNRDGKITAADRGKATDATPLLHWINDDVDTGNTAPDTAGDTSDLPGRLFNPNYADDIVNGRRDLLDFIPVWLDIKYALDNLPSGADVQCRLSGAANAVCSSLFANTASNFLTNDVPNCGPALKQYAHSADVLQAAGSGTNLPAVFLNLIRGNANQGILLLEGREAAADLRLDFLADGEPICWLRLPMRVRPVEDMYIRVDGTGGAFTPNSPSYLPPSNGKHVVFLHGANVSPQDARAWHAEMFKRLRQSGSNARFHGVTWRGDQGLPSAFHYHENVLNAFCAAQYLRDYVNGLPGEKSVMAHSLGNMAVCSAIKDWGMKAGKTFLLNAAIPAEALDKRSWRDSPGTDNRMVHDDWRAYTNICWSAKYHEFFAVSQSGRAGLSWRDRFFGIHVNTSLYQFFSSSGGDDTLPNTEDGDEVFELRNGTPTTLAGITSSWGQYAWQKQETHKGRAWFDPAGTSWAGWGFGRPAYTEWQPDPSTGLMLPYTVYYYPDAAAANAAPPAQLRDIPVFRYRPSAMFTSNSFTLAYGNEILAKGIPSLSPAAGKVRLGPLENLKGSFNMNTELKPANGTWGRSGGPYYTRWLHSDIKNMAYFYTSRFFGKLVELGGLK